MNTPFAYMNHSNNLEASFANINSHDHFHVSCVIFHLTFLFFNLGTFNVIWIPLE